jgi:hypothetical protein
MSGKSPVSPGPCLQCLTRTNTDRGIGGLTVPSFGAGVPWTGGTTLPLPVAGTAVQTWLSHFLHRGHSSLSRKSPRRTNSLKLSRRLYQVRGRCSWAKKNGNCSIEVMTISYTCFSVFFYMGADYYSTQF